MNQLTTTPRPQIRTPWQRIIEHRCGLGLACCAASGVGQTSKFVPCRTAFGIRTHDIVRKRLPPAVRSIAFEYTIEAVDLAEHCLNVADAFLVPVKPQGDACAYVFTEGPTGDRCFCPIQWLPTGTCFCVPARRLFCPVTAVYSSLFHRPEPRPVGVAVKERCDCPDKLQLASFQRPIASPSAAVLQDVDRPTSRDTTFDDVRRRQARSVRSRGTVTKQVEAINSDFASRKVLPPSTYRRLWNHRLRRSGSSGQQPELVLDIPLRSRAYREKMLQ